MYCMYDGSTTATLLALIRFATSDKHFHQVEVLVVRLVVDVGRAWTLAVAIHGPLEAVLILERQIWKYN